MFAKTNNPTKRAFRRYNVELGVSMVAYMVTMAISRKLLYGSMKDAGRSWQVAIALMPLVPAIAAFAAIVRCIRGVDERLYRMFVDSLAIAGGITALLAVTYGLIEGDLFPPLSAWWTYSVFMLSWLAVSLFVRRRY